MGSGERARCEKHFKEEFGREVRRTVREFGMIGAGERVAVALSGGKDSVVLLHQLAELKKKLPMELLAILVDEGIAGYRAPTIKVAKRECRKLGVKLHIVSFKSEIGSSLDAVLKKRPARRHGRGAGGHASPLGACSFCGVFRRLLLNKAARRLGADKLALGHNLDDAAQTVLLNLYRNEPARLARFWPVSVESGEGGPARAPGAASAARKPGASPPDFIPRIRPLIRIPEREVALLAELEGYGICHRSCPYAHEAMRQTVRAQLNEMEDRYPGTKKRIFNSWMAMGPAMKKMDEETEAGPNGKKKQTPMGRCSSCGEPSSKEECAACRMRRQFYKHPGR